MEVPRTVKDMEEGYSIYPILITVGLILIIIAGVIAASEFLGGKRFCSSVNGEYSLKVFPLPIVHYCNGEGIFQYSDGWDFNREIDYAVVFP